MSANAVNVAVIDNKTITESVELRITKQGMPVRLKAVQNGKYLIAEGTENPVAPENITIKRVGQDLHVATEGTSMDQPQLIIEGFFDSQGQLVGVAEDGSYHEYISSDAEQDHAAAFLKEGVTSPQVLGAQELPGFGEGLVAGSGLGLFWPALLGLGALGVLGGAYAVVKHNRDKDDNNDDDRAVSTRPPVPSVSAVGDNVGDIQGPIENGGSTDDRTPTFGGSGTPGNVVVIEDKGVAIGEVVIGDDGNWEFTPVNPLPEGDHSIVVVERDKGGNTSDPSIEFDFVVDVTAPGQAVIGSITDNVGAQQGVIAANGETDDNTPTLNGTAEAGATVQVFDNGVKIGETIAGADGAWSFTPATALLDGSHSFTSVAVDLAGNAGLPSVPYIVNIETGAPGKPGVGTGGIDEALDNVGPVVGNIENGGVTDDTTPTFGGSGAVPGDTVSIIDNGVKIGEVIVDAGGNWSFTPSPELSEGQHSVVVEITDPQGNTSEPSDPYLIIVDTTPPVQPGVGTGGIEEALDNVGPITGPIENGGITDDTTPTFSGGGATPGDTVSIIDNGVEIGEAIVDAGGNWEFTPNPELGEGNHEIVVVITDPAGNESLPSDPYLIIVDTTPPVQPGVGTGGIEEALDNVGPVTGPIENGGSTDDTTPTFSGGGATPGDTVSIIDNGVEIGEVIVDAGGNWEFTPNPELAEGNHEIVVVITDPAGNASLPSDPYLIIVDTTQPVQPGVGTGGIGQALDDVGPITGPIENGGTTDDTTPTFSGGGATPGDTVSIIDNGVEIGEVIVDAGGNWEFTPNPELGEGAHEIVVVITDPAGNESLPSDPYIVIVDTTPPVQPGAGTGGIDEALDNVGPITGPIENGGTTDDTTPTFTGGGATPGDTVSIIDNGVEIGEAIVDAGGNWEFTPNPELGEGNHEIVVVITDPAGNASLPSDPYIVIVDTTVPVLPAIGSVIDDQGNVTGPINAGDITDDAQLTFNGTAEANSTIILYDNGVEIGRVPVDATGNWTFTPAVPMANGQHDVTIVAQDAAGNQSAPSAGFNFELVAGGTPPAPAITGINDDVADVIGNVSPGGSTNDATPEIMGTAQAGSTVSVYANGMLLGTTMADAVTGAWSFSPATPLTDGVQNITASASNAAGNVSPTTGNYTIIIDTSAPVAATGSELVDDVGLITGPIANGDTTDDSTPTFNGMAEANSTVIISDNGVEIGRVLADATGAWTFTPAPALTDGPHSLTTVVVDASGNRSPESAAIGFVVDTTAVTISITQVTDDFGANQGPLANGSVTDDTTPTLSGQATPGSTVTIYLNGVPLQMGVPVNAAGEWSYTVAPALAEGSYAFSAAVVTAAGGVSAPTANFNLEIDTTASVTPVIDDVRDDVGSVQGPVANGGSTDDTTPTLSGRGVAGDVIIISDNGVELGRATVGATGAWSFTPNPPLNDGSHEFTLVAQDAAGNQSVPSAGYTVIVDTVAPVLPAIGSVIDDQGNVTGPINPGDITDDSQPTFNGTAEANSTVIVYDNGVEIGRAPVDATGNWTFTPTAPLANGQHDVTVAVQDAAGNVSGQTAGFGFELVAGGTPPAPAITGINDDVADVIGNVSPGGSTNDATPEVIGTALPGSVVSVLANGILLGTTVADAVTGAWSFTPATPLTDGVQNITASASNAAGNTSPLTGNYTITIDTSAPAAATGGELVDDVGLITGPIANGDTTDDSTPTFNGAAEPNSTVIISDNGVEIGRVLVDATGAWTFTPAPALLDGPHSLSTVVVDAAGNRSPESAAIGFVVDTTAVTISITQVTDDFGANQGPLANGSVTDDTTPTLSGQATPGSTVTIYLNGVPLQMGVPVNAAGEWTYTVAPALAEGSYVFTAAVVTAAGGVSAQTAGFNLEVDTTPSAAPVIDDVRDDVGTVQGSVANGGSTDDTTPTLSGSGVAGDVIIISDNGVELGRATVGATGAWSFTPNPPLNDGNHEFTLVAQDLAGNQSAPTAGYTVIIDTVAPVLPAIGSVIDDQGNVTGPINAGDITDDSQPTFNGTAEANSTVIVYDNGVEIGRAPVDATGNWTFTPTAPLANGQHDVTVAVQDAAGNVSGQTAGFGFELVAGGTPPAPAITGINDDVADVIGNVSPGGSTNDATPEVIGTALPGSVVSVLANGILLGTTVADAVTGAWSFTPATPLTDGVQNITASASNAAGNTSPLTGNYTITIDTSAPAAATGGELVDDVGLITGPIANGDTTDDSTPTFNGAAEPNSTVIISDNGVEIGRVLVDATGAWTFTPALALIDGPHSLSTVVVDAAGNRSPESAAIGFVVDTTAVTISITQVTDDFGASQGPLGNGSVTDDTTPTLSGQATPGSTVNIYLNGVPLQTGVTVNAAGQWSYTVAPALAEGSHVFTATVVTAAGGESAPTAGFNLEIDTTPSATPVVDDVRDDVGTVQGSVANGGSTDDTTPTLSGSGVAGDVIIISDNGVELGRATVGATGAWSYTPNPPLNDGNHEFTVVSQDPAGNQSAPTAGYTVIVDTVAPVLPAIGSVIDDQGNTTGPINPGDTTDDSQPTFNGIAEANSTVIIYDNGVEIGRAPVDATGNWTFTPTTPLTNGQHDVTVAVQDAAGNVSGQTAGFGFELAAGGTPPAPAITGITDDVPDFIGNVPPGGLTNDAMPEVIGTALPGSTVSVFANGMLLGTTLADAVTGAWSFTPATPLADGVQNITASATNAAGNTSPVTGDYEITVDTVPPTTLSITADMELIDDVGAITGPIASGDITDDNTPTFSGTTEANSVVIVLDNGVEIGRVRTDNLGAWTFTPAPALIDGPHSLSTIVVDAAGNRSPESAAIGFVVDTTAVVISITQVIDDFGPNQGSLANGSVTDDTTPTLSGQATPGSTVNIYLNGVPLQTGVTVNAAGQWSYTVSPALAEGSYAFTATAVTAAAGESAPTAGFNLEIDTTPSATPVIDDVRDDVGAVQGSVANGGSTDDTTPTLSGRGVAGDVIIISDNGVVMGRVTVGATGAWSFTPNPPLNDGSHEFTLVAQDLAGNQSVPSAGYTVIIDTVAPVLPAIGSVIDDQGNVTGPINAGDITDDSQPTFNGTAEANSTVIVYDNGVEIGRAPVDATGNWTFTPTTPLTNGQHDVTVAAQDAAGNVSGPSAGFGFELVAGGTPPAPTITGINDDVADVIGNVASGGLTNDARPEVIGTAQAGSIVSVFANGILLGTTLADAVTGAWRFTPATPLADGMQNITASARNAAGNDSPATADYLIIIDTTAPAAATGSELIDNVGAVLGPIANGDTTDDNTPTFNGMAEANSTVIIRDNGVEIGRVQTDATGAWTFTPAPALIDGAHSLSAVVVDGAGNLSPESAAIGFIVDTTAPAQALVVSMSKDSGADSGDFITNDGSAGRLIQGSLTAALAADEKVQVSTDGGLTWLDALLNGTAGWSFVDNSSHAGNWVIQTRVVDAAGNANVASQSVTLDTTAPDAPASVAVSGSTVTVGLTTTSGVAGDTLKVVWGDARVDHVLTEADIAARSVSVVIPADVIAAYPSVSNLSAGVVDAQGNSSNYRTRTTFTTDGFEESRVFRFEKVGDAIATKLFGVRWVDNVNLDHVPRIFYVAPETVYPFHGNVLHFSGTMEFYLKQGTATSLTLSSSLNDVPQGHIITFYADNGAVVWRGGFGYPGATFSSVVTDTFEMPNGRSFRSFTLSTGYYQDGFSDHILIDNLIVGGLNSSGGVVAPPLEQTIVDSDAYIGGVADNIFNLADVDYFLGGTAGIDGGGGIDSLVLKGADQVLDLAIVGDKLSSIEIIDITGTGNNTLNISLGDILELGETSLFVEDDKVQMLIKGNVGDVVNLDDLLADGTDPGDWANLGVVTVAGVVYDVYQHSTLGAELLVQQGVTTILV